MDTLLLSHKYTRPNSETGSGDAAAPSSSSATSPQERNELLGEPSVAGLVVPFVACGDLENEGFDADKSYPLDLKSPSSSGSVNASASASAAVPPTAPADGEQQGGYVYRYHAPVQPPIRPNYYTYLQEHQHPHQQKGKSATASQSSAGAEENAK